MYASDLGNLKNVLTGGASARPEMSSKAAAGSRPCTRRPIEK
jgi:hypothetical protein